MPDSEKNRTTDRNNEYSPLTAQFAFQLAAPHTWAASLMPVLVSYAYSAVSFTGRLSLGYALILLFICVLMQSAVNTLNDYYDYKKGTDNLDNSSSDAFDAVLVYNHLNPRSVLALAIGFLVVAGVLGIYLVLVTGWQLLVIGIVGALAVVLYSAGRTPISYLPIGEAVSGFVMGGLIPLACCYVLTGVLQAQVLLVALPCMVGIGMIMATNNTCDLEKDSQTTRKTLAVLLGRERAMRAYHATLYVWIVLIVGIVGIFYAPGTPLLIFMVLGAFGPLRGLLNNPLNQSRRDIAMQQMTTLNIVFHTFYSFAILAAGVISWI